MSVAVIGIFYKTLKPAMQRAQQEMALRRNKIRFRVVGREGQYIVVSEAALKAAGILPRRKKGITL